MATELSDTINLLTFKAGKVDFEPSSKHCKPLPQKGKITLSRPRNDDEPLLSFIWEPRGSSKNDPSVEKDELMIFPGDAEWVPVPQCKTGRVFALKFSSSSQRSFFWMQDPPEGDKLDEVSDADLKISTRINTLFEDVFADEVDISEDHAEPATETGAAEHTGDVEMADSTPSQGNNDSATQSPFLTDLLRSISIPTSGLGPATAGAPGSISNITDAVSASQIASYVNSLDAADSRLTSLYNFLPAEIAHNKMELLRVLQSPQFLQGLNSFSQTLHSSEGFTVGQLVSQELGMPYRGEGIEGFLRGILAAVQSEHESDQNQPEDTNMQE
ncbi:proteasome complex subunit Rpn13 ubiquitin receptor-domain-containing protein [Lipomyces arxii]|uniref:proteasome complex subunit Rpn13 ubiquitin receptor-domain-containing protein n=1 Tax=Lipomyces arxii TaxID=56418 RepID=UPI0034CF091E